MNGRDVYGRLVGSALALALTIPSAAAKCIVFSEAPKHVGDIACVTGKVVKVAQSKSGSWFLNFCADYRKCPFTAVVFPSNLRDVGDVRQLEGKDVEIHGRIQLWRGRPEIILRDARQLRGEAANIPPVPRDFDVQRKGRFRAGSIKAPGAGAARKSSSPAKSRQEPSDEP